MRMSRRVSHRGNRRNKKIRRLKLTQFVWERRRRIVSGLQCVRGFQRLYGLLTPCCGRRIFGKTARRRSRRWWSPGRWSGACRPVRPGPSRPGPCQQLAAHPVQLADMAPPETAQEGSQGGWRLDRAAQGAGGSAGALHVGVVNAVAARQRRRHQGHHLVACVRPARALPRSRRCWTSSRRPRCWARVTGRISPALATRRWSSKEIWIRSGWSSGSIFWVLLVWGGVCVSETIIPEAQEHFFNPSAPRHSSFRWIGANAGSGVGIPRMLHGRRQNVPLGLSTLKPATWPTLWPSFTPTTSARNRLPTPTVTTGISSTAVVPIGFRGVGSLRRLRCKMEATM